MVIGKKGRVGTILVLYIRAFPRLINMYNSCALSKAEHFKIT